jgi:hypothetical protein
LFEEHVFEGVLGFEGFEEAGDELLVDLDVIGMNDGAFGGESVGDGVLGGAGFAFGRDGPVGLRAVAAGGFGLGG